ncbi:hypothetical protein F4678DRAFT_425532 [Xylaria arbuscula]|nr:hypothetical protein F4678DRAFT_425532 [Xylaria arbuscula]
MTPFTARAVQIIPFIGGRLSLITTWIMRLLNEVFSWFQQLRNLRHHLAKGLFRLPDAMNKAVKRAFPFHHAAWRVQSRAISAMVNQVDQADQKRLIAHWRTSMLSQLTNVEIIGSIMIAAIVGAFTWTNLPTLAIVEYSIVRATWYCSLILAVGAVALSVQQTVFLIRIGCLPIANQICIDMLSYELAGTNSRAPRRCQVVLWRTANGLLEVCIYLWLAGFAVFIYGITEVSQAEAFLGDKVVAALCFFSFFTVVILYLWSILHLWHIAGRNIN